MKAVHRAVGARVSCPSGGTSGYFQLHTEQWVEGDSPFPSAHGLCWCAGIFFNILVLTLPTFLRGTCDGPLVGSCGAGLASGQQHSSESGL